MADNADLVTLITAITCVQEAKKLMNKKKRRWWVRPAYQKRKELSEFNKLIPILRMNDPEMYFRYMRMSPDQFDHLLSLLGKHLTKSSFREPVSASERLTITLTYLATGSSQQDMSFRFHRGRSTISHIVKETCDVIWNTLHSEYLETPHSEHQWKDIATKYWEKWNFPNCVGSIDGKHFNIQCPKLTGSKFFNYKQHFSSLVLAMCDADYKFTYALFGNEGREGDAGVFAKSDIFHSLEESKMNFPQPICPPGFNELLPYVILGDEAFLLKPYLMRPFPGRGRVVLSYREQVYNYRLSRARRCIENAFGILVARWRIFRTPIIANIENVEAYIKATFVLHNYLRNNDTRQLYIPPGYVDHDNEEGFLIEGDWRKEIQGSTGVTSMLRIGSNMSTRDVIAMRESFANYLVSPTGSVPWQNTKTT